MTTEVADTSEESAEMDPERMLKFIALCVAATKGTDMDQSAKGNSEESEEDMFGGEVVMLNAEGKEEDAMDTVESLDSLEDKKEKQESATAESEDEPPHGLVDSSDDEDCVSKSWKAFKERRQRMIEQRRAESKTKEPKQECEDHCECKQRRPQ